MSNLTEKQSRRIQSKRDYEVNWRKAENFTPLDGEQIVYKAEVDKEGKAIAAAQDFSEYPNTGYPEGRKTPIAYPRIKIGDGVTKVNDLPFIQGGIGEEYPDGGEIFNDYENNQALSEFSHAEGNQTVAGSKAFKIKEMHEFGDTGEGRFLLESVEGLSAGMKYTAVLTNNFDFVGVIESVVESNAEYGPHIVVKGLPSGSGTTIKSSSYLLIPDRPDLGDIVIGEYAHAEGTETTAQAKAAHAEGNKTNAAGKYAHAEGHSTVAAYAAHAEGHTTEAIGEASHSEGKKSKATKLAAHAEGSGTSATAEAAHSEGRNTHAENTSAHAEGEGTAASGFAAHSEGQDTAASGDQSHAEGYDTDATGTAAHAEGAENLAEGYAAHAEGHKNQAKGDMSHAGGFESIANARGSFVHGSNLIAEHNDQAVFGQFNDPGEYEDLFIVGNGNNDEQRANAFVVHRDGTATIQHGPINNNDVADKEYVDDVADSTKSFAQGQVNNYKSEVNAKFALVDTNFTTVEKSITDNATLAENTYVKKVTPSSGKRVYTVEANSDGTSSQGSKPFNHSYYSEGWSLVQRDGNGKILAKDPENEYDVTNKRYVDDADAILDNKITEANGAATNAFEKAEEATSIAKGANQAFVFDSEYALIRDTCILPMGYLTKGTTIICSTSDTTDDGYSVQGCYFSINGESIYEYDPPKEDEQGVIYPQPIFYYKNNLIYFLYVIPESINIKSIDCSFSTYDGEWHYTRSVIITASWSTLTESSVTDKYLMAPEFKVGTNFYIKMLNVPDYWWDGNVAQPLETQKVDLTEYATQEWVEDKGYLTTHQDISHKLDKTEFTEFTDKFIGDADNHLASPITTEIQVPVQGNTTDNGTDTLYHAMSVMNEQLLELREKVGTDSITIGNTEFTEAQLIKILNFINKIEMTGGTN